MAFSGAQVSRLGLYGGSRFPYGSFAGKTEQEVVAGGVKARRIKFKDIDPVWKQKEKETDWIDDVIEAQEKKLKTHKPDVINVKATVDEQIREIYQAQAVKVRIKKRKKQKALAMILMEM